MALLATGLPVNTASSLPQAAPAATATAALLPGQVPSIARLITPQAVSAPAAAQAFAPGIAQPPKPVIRTAPNPAASPLAAQFIAQDTASDDTLAIFNPPPPPALTPENAARALINDLRQARGDIPAPATTNAAVSPPAPTAQSAAALAAQPIRINTAALSAPAAPAPTATLDPPPRVNNVVRKPGLADSTGPEAYRLAVQRNGRASSNLVVVG